MSDTVKLIIEIPKDTYDGLMNNRGVVIPSYWHEYVADLCKNGTPLDELIAESKEELTNEKAIAFLQDNGWLVEHDRIMTSGIENKGDLISRKSLLNKINAYVVGSQDKEFICKLIKEMPSVENKGEWIPVSERLPEMGVRVLCACQADLYDVLKLTPNGWFYDTRHTYMLGFVRAWQSLPEPYKEKE